jgi:Kef-type K+ transport system membrane component KefB
MIIISICVLLLFAYVFDLTSSKTKIPSVILLLLLGSAARYTATYFEWQVPNLFPLLPVFGTVGLILIVLEGTLDLKLNKTKLPIIKKSFLVAFIPIVLLGVFLALLFHYIGNFSFKQSLANAIPLCVISSSIAIPSARNMNENNREFIIYESSLSDILGVLFFNFIALNEIINGVSVLHFILEVIVICLISFVATGILSVLLNRIEHHVKFIPIMILVILIYAISKEYHLPALIFILIFGLFLSNLQEIKKIKGLGTLNTEKLEIEVVRFHELVAEATFLIRALFFLLFGYLIQLEELLNQQTLVLTLIIIAAILLIRWIVLKLFSIPLNPLLFIAPRGLITILLFLSLPASQNISIVNNSLMTQIVVISALIMMIGLFFQNNDAIENIQ